MDRGDFLFPVVKIKLIASVVAEKNASKIGKIMEQFHIFYEQGRLEVQASPYKFRA